MNKNAFLITLLLLIKFQLNAQHTLHFVKDTIEEFSGKSRYFSSDTIDFSTLSSIKFDSIKINKSDSLNRFYMNIYVRNDTDSDIILTDFRTNAGDNVPYWKQKPLMPNKIACYTIMQGYFREKSMRYGTLGWQYFDKNEKQKMTKSIVISYYYELTN